MKRLQFFYKEVFKKLVAFIILMFVCFSTIVLSCFGGGGGGGGGGGDGGGGDDGDGSDPSKPDLTFNLEVDHQKSYDPRNNDPYILEDVQNIFYRDTVPGDTINAQTNISLWYDEANYSTNFSTPMPDQDIMEKDLEFYHKTHKIVDGVDEFGKDIYRYKGHLLIIQYLANDNGTPYKTTHGESLAGRYQYSYVALATMPNASDKTFRLKVICHELGHHRGDLDHPCYNDNGILKLDYVNHSDESCCMGQGRKSACTGKFLDVDPYFCDICEKNLYNVGGAW